jgi:hypothetical protein
LTVLTVGPGRQYATIAGAVAASQSGDTIEVDAGIYTNDFTHIDHSLTLRAVDGMVTMEATISPPDGKAILTEGGAGIDVKIDGFAFTGAVVPDGNGAGIRYEGGSLTITNSHFYGNQDGILGAADPNGVIAISHSEFDHNGIGGDGHTHNIYIGAIDSFTLSDSFIHDANIGHEVKSRAANNTILNNRIFDNNSTSSYAIDLPNGGNATISGNIIEQGPNSQNSNIIAYGEEGSLNAGTTLSVSGNTFVNDEFRGPALWNASGIAVASFTNNAVYGFDGISLVSGQANQSGTILLGARPALDQSAPYSVGTVPPPVMPPPPVAPPLTGVSISPEARSLAGAQGGDGLNGNSALASVGQIGGPTGDSYSYSLAGTDATSFILATTSNKGMLSTGAATVPGAINGRLHALTVTATDLTSGSTSSATLLDVVIGAKSNDTISGSTLSGALRLDTPTFIYGLGGNDRIDGTGMSGPLWFIGGAGGDKMTGGSGVNAYLYGTASESTSSNMDIIANFHASVDKIDLRGLGLALNYVGQLTGLASKTGLAAHSVGWQTSGGNTFIYANTSGKGEGLVSANMKIELQGVVTLSGADIVHL